MHILICGAGTFGASIANYLVTESELDLTVIDSNPKRISDLEDRLDVRAIAGSASHPDDLSRARAHTAQVLIAASKTDELNVLTALVASKMFAVEQVIVRIRDAAYLHESDPNFLHPAFLPEQRVIMPEDLVANSVIDRLSVPAAIESRLLLDERVYLLCLRIVESCPVVDTPLKELTRLFPDMSVRILSIERDQTSFIPSSVDMLHADDLAYFLAEASQLDRILEAFGYEPIEEEGRLVLIGGGHVGEALLEKLTQQNGNQHSGSREAEEERLLLRHFSKISVIEYAAERADALAKKFPSVPVYCGDALDSEIQSAADVPNATDIVALTERDEVNVLGALIAQNSGAQCAIALIGSYFFGLGSGNFSIDILHRPWQVSLAAILPYIRRGSYHDIWPLKNARSEVFDFTVPAGAPIVGKTIEEVGKIKDVLIGVIVRDDVLLFPRSQDKINTQDRVIAIVSRRSIPQFEALLLSQ